LTGVLLNRLLRSGIMTELLKDLWMFLKERKKWWLLPIIAIVLLIGSIVIFSSGTAVAPFIYTLF